MMFLNQLTRRSLGFVLVGLTSAALTAVTLGALPASAWTGDPAVQYVRAVDGNKAYRKTMFTTTGWSTNFGIGTLYVNSISGYTNIYSLTSVFSCAYHNAWGSGPRPPADIRSINMTYWNTPQNDTRAHSWFVDSAWGNGVTIYTGVTNTNNHCFFDNYLARMYDDVYWLSNSISSVFAGDITSFP